MSATLDIQKPAQAVPQYRAATFRDAVRSEWTKARTVPSTRWTLVAAAVLGIGLGALISAVTAHQYAKGTASVRASWDPTGISTAGLALAQLALAVLGVLIVSSEYATGAIRASLTAVPRRGRFLAAKALVVGALIFVSAELITFLTFFIGQALISGHAPVANLGQPGVLRALVGCGLYGALIALFGLALGSILRRAAGAISVLVGFIFVLPGVAAALPASVERNVEKFWPTQAGQQITNVVRASNTLSPWAGLGVMAAFVAIVLCTAFILLKRRDA